MSDVVALLSGGGCWGRWWMTFRLRHCWCRLAVSRDDENFISVVRCWLRLSLNSLYYTQVDAAGRSLTSCRGNSAVLRRLTLHLNIKKQLIDQLIRLVNILHVQPLRQNGNLAPPINRDLKFVPVCCPASKFSIIQELSLAGEDSTTSE